MLWNLREQSTSITDTFPHSGCPSLSNFLIGLSYLHDVSDLLVFLTLLSCFRPVRCVPTFSSRIFQSLCLISDANTRFTTGQTSSLHCFLDAVQQYFRLLSSFYTFVHIFSFSSVRVPGFFKLYDEQSHTDEKVPNFNSHYISVSTFSWCLLFRFE